MMLGWPTAFASIRARQLAPFAGPGLRVDHPAVATGSGCACLAVNVAERLAKGFYRELHSCGMRHDLPILRSCSCD